MKKYLIIIVLALGFVLQSCLPLMDDFQYTPSPRENNMKMSAWSFINQRAEFQSFVSLIKVSGIDTMLYAQTQKKYTYLILNANAVALLLNDKYASSIPNMSSLTDVQKADLRNRLLYHIIDGYYYGLPGGNLGFDPVNVITLWKDKNAVMVLKLDQTANPTYASLTDCSFAVNSYAPVAPTTYKAITSNLFVTNGVMDVMGNYASYDNISR
jgi:Fasciclin domain